MHQAQVHDISDKLQETDVPDAIMTLDGRCTDLEAFSFGMEVAINSIHVELQRLCVLEQASDRVDTLEQLVAEQGQGTAKLDEILTARIGSLEMQSQQYVNDDLLIQMGERLDELEVLFARGPDINGTPWPAVRSTL